MMGNSIPIHIHCCPIFARQANRVYFAGSAFFFLHKKRVLVATADHVVKPYLNASFEVATTAQAYSVEVLLRDPEYDLCILQPANYPVGISMTLSADRLKPRNVTLYAYEFSTTEIENNKYKLNPATRIGNCVRTIEMGSIYGSAGKDMLELSFPALKGASGSAVIEIENNLLIVHGVIVANSEHHLLPAHIETVLDEKNTILEERMYFLPQGVAVNSTHLLRLANAAVEKISSENV